MSSRSPSPVRTTDDPAVDPAKSGKGVTQDPVQQQKVEDPKPSVQEKPATGDYKTNLGPQKVSDVLQDALKESLMDKYNVSTSGSKTPPTDQEKGKKHFEEPKDPYGDAARQAAAERLRRALESGSVENQRADQAATFDPSDVFKMPSNSDLKSFKREKIVTDIATPDEISEIAREFVSEGVPRDKLSYAMWDIARYCADVGSSEYTTFRGASADSGGVERVTLGAIIRRVCTLRQFCSYFAAIIWNMMVLNNDPPANWQKKGYTESTKFAAFDFFSAVTNSAALQPKNGLAKKVEQEEIIANQTQKEVSLHRVASRQNKNASNYVEVTGGRSGPKPTLHIREISES
ncbi:coat protein [Camellia ringspot associated virus 4]|uniref:Capsid protein n=1 Tax=Camellia ringspot associated virus 4 TaxID=2791164 RepID=A0A7S9TQG8_9VIRU|nr:coat protein [Camellia ringspot associated virus 4]QPI34842.1 coat protein [Camellia ringspot associated virus 4]